MAEASVSTATLASPVATEPVVLREPKKPDKAGFLWGTGRRKTAVARVRIKPGSGKFTVNGKAVEAFFTEIRDHNAVRSPLKVTNTTDSLDIVAAVKGGGFTGQAGAVMLGLARALKDYDPSIEPALRENSLLTRDARKVERKKYGQSGARRRFQFSKR